MERKLAIIGIIAILLFVGFFAVVVPMGATETIFSKALIALIVIGAVIPWFYLLESTRGKVSKKQQALFFIGSCFLAPYFLIKIGANKNAP